MANKPPPLPHETLSRVLNVASFNGRLLLIMAGSLAILHAAQHHPAGATVGVLVAGTGALLLHGAEILRTGDPRGVDWLVRSQLLLLAVMLIFSATQLMRPAQDILDELRSSPEAAAVLEQTPIPQLQFAQIINGIFYVSVGLASLIYAGPMALYYHRRRNIVTTALDDELFEALDDRD
ncbi:MAG: hypothetical protein QM760_16210 [Nibricoccus sp.]